MIDVNNANYFEDMCLHVNDRPFQRNEKTGKENCSTPVLLPQLLLCFICFLTISLPGMLWTKTYPEIYGNIRAISEPVY